MGDKQSRQSKPVKDIVEEAIATNPVVIFSKTYCPYCKAAKSAIKEAGGKVTGFDAAVVFEMDIRADGAGMQEYLRQKTGRSSVPNVFIGGRSVGGGDDTVGYLRSGVLPQMIAAAVNALRPGVAAAAPAAAAVSAGTDVRVVLFGAGCFWGVELAFQRERGVVRTEVGYANGATAQVSYQAVCTGRTGHAEVVKVWYRPAEVSFERLLELWESRHDVTSKNKQGNDRGTQYRSALFYTDDEQKMTALKWRKDANERLGGRVVADIGPVTTYCAAEDVHQRYLERRGQSAAKDAKSTIRCYG